MITNESYDALFARISTSTLPELDALESTTDEDEKFMLSTWLARQIMAERRAQLSTPAPGLGNVMGRGIAMSQDKDGRVRVFVNGRPIPPFYPAPTFADNNKEVLGP